MSPTIAYRHESATVEEIVEHLVRCDDDFVPPLGGRVELRAYAEKIAQLANRFEAWLDGRLVGLVAAYCDGAEGGTAFITSVSVDQEVRGTGVAARLLAMCVGRAVQEGLQRIELVVDSDNGAALRLYTRCGFVARASKDGGVVMRLDEGEFSGSGQRA